MAARSAGLAWVAVSKVLAWTLPVGPSVGVLPVQRAPASEDLDGLHRVREGQLGGHGGDFEGAPLGAAVARSRGVMGSGDLAPGQGGDAWRVVLGHSKLIITLNMGTPQQ